MLERVEDSGSLPDAGAELAMVPQAPAPADSDVVRDTVPAMEPIFEAPEPVVRRVGLTAQLQEKLDYAKALLSHVTRDETEVLERALDTLIAKLEARKFGKTERPRRQRPSKSPRHIPANVKRAVYVRDGGRCTFVGDHGHRCETRDLLQFDHIIPEAKGGTSTEDNLRLRCRSHNQLEADRAFGAAFMRSKREARRTKALAPEQESKRNDLIAGLRNLGYSAARAHWAAAQCANRLDLSLEGLVRHALVYLAPMSVRRSGGSEPAPAPAP
jgi:5-methylcytosine-specific restriction endonuclease McrA